ncbi:MAG TPA: hypothetical protein VMG40_09025 [Bryobacteraceae bacterium]|nr:hypothetical protein [Bryobacteraceae bacterium]
MRRLAPVLAASFVLTGGCRIHRHHAEETNPEGNQLVSVVNVADPRTATQLTRGFWDLEHDSWRWTAKSFTVTLRPPANASKTGATLELKFTIPDVMFNRVGAMTLDARVNGLDLGAQTYSQAGDCTYSRVIPAVALSSDAVAVDFHVDKGLPPSDQDTRELAVIVTTVGLISK